MPVTRVLYHDFDFDGDILYCSECEAITQCSTCRNYSRCHYCHSNRADGQNNLTEYDWQRISELLPRDDDSTEFGYLLRGYSAEPDNGWQPRGDGKLFFGMELEVTCYSRRALRNAMRNVGDLCIFKHDGSVNGFEMVTHPMSYEYAMSEFPWSALPAMENDGCSIQPVNNGLHIHVSREGFNGDAHTYTWEKFMHKNARNVNRIARRRNNDWCRWTDSTNENYFPDLMRRKARDNWEKAYREFNHLQYADIREYIESERFANASNRERMARRTLEITDRRFSYTESPNRYSAINIQNPDTIEVRCFASTLSPLAAKAALGLMHASIAYTATVRAHDVLRNHGWAWRTFREYVSQNAATYPALEAVIDTAPVPLHASATFPETRS